MAFPQRMLGVGPSTPVAGKHCLAGSIFQTLALGLPADDFESVRRALNIARWNLYGESYGTDVAMTLAALHPAAVRSMVLDSIYPPDAPRPLRATSVAAARKAFFALCDSDPNCFAVSGDLARAYDEAKAQLARNPLTLTRPPGSKSSNERFVLTASVFELVVANLLYYRNAYPTVPLVIMWAKNGAREPLASVTAKLYEAALTRQVATNAAVECRDRPHFRGATPAPDDIFAHRAFRALRYLGAPWPPAAHTSRLDCADANLGWRNRSGGRTTRKP